MVYLCLGQVQLSRTSFPIRGFLFAFYFNLWNFWIEGMLQQLILFCLDFRPMTEDYHMIVSGIKA